MRSRTITVVALSVVTVACGSGSDDAVESVPEITLITTTTEAPPETTVAETDRTTPAETVGSTDGTPATDPTEVTTTEPPVATDPPPTEAPTTVATTTTEPAESRFTLATDGLGTTSFGADPDGTVAFISTFLGPPTADTGWVDPFTIGPCGGSELRQVNWGSLQLEFGDASGITEGRRHFYAYTYGREGESVGVPAGLETPEGITIGSTVGALLAAYPSTQLIQGDEFISDNFVVNDNLRGRLSGLTDADVVQVIIGGLPCDG